VRFVKTKRINRSVTQKAREADLIGAFAYGDRVLVRMWGMKNGAGGAKKSAIALAFAGCFDYLSASFDGEHS